ncbi:MAG: MFS transporter [Janthinobacterium lividum]
MVLQLMSVEKMSDPSAPIFRRVACRIMPFICLCYSIAYLDRVNVGFAKLEMLRDLGMSEAAYGLGAGLFFIGYIILELPSSAALQKIGAKIWIARIMVSWGVLSGLTAFVTEPWQFNVLRFLLGAAEAGFLPGVLFYLTTWFPSYRRARIISLFMIGVPLSSIIGSPLSGWIMGHMQHVAALHGWQWLFLMEAAPTVLLGIATLFVLPNDPQGARWLSDDEKVEIQGTLAADQDEASTSRYRFRDGALDIKIWMLGGIDFSLLLCTYALSFWLPTFIRQTGVQDIFTIGLLTALPSVASLVCILLIGTSSDRRRERRWHIIVPFIVGAAALAGSTYVTSNVVATVLLFSVASGMITGTVSVIFSLPSTFLKGAAAASGFALACSLANIAGLVSNVMIGLASDLTGSSGSALWLFSGSLLVSSVLVFMLPPKVVNR